MASNADFEDAQKRVNGLSKTPDNTTLLALYGLYKQASVGDVRGKRPGRLNIRARAKYDSWAGYKGKSGDDARADYVALVDRLLAADQGS